MSQHEDNQSNNHKTSDGEPPFFVGAAVRWIGGTLSLGLFYLVTGPWIVLLLCACNDAFMNAKHPLGKAVELLMYPAYQLANSFEFYGKYFWSVLEPLGG